MTEPLSIRETYLNLLEHWLPLAQQENSTQQWGYSPATLEKLILVAAPALRQTHTLLAARAVLWHYHHQIHPSSKGA